MACAGRSGLQGAAGTEGKPEFTCAPGTFARMSTVQEIEAAIKSLTPGELQRVHEWLEVFVEDQMELTDEFKGEIVRAKADLANGSHSRIVKPE